MVHISCTSFGDNSFGVQSEPFLHGSFGLVTYKVGLQCLISRSIAAKTEVFFLSWGIVLWVSPPKVMNGTRTATSSFTMQVCAVSHFRDHMQWLTSIRHSTATGSHFDGQERSLWIEHCCAEFLQICLVPSWQQRTKCHWMLAIGGANAVVSLAASQAVFGQMIDL